MKNDGVKHMTLVILAAGIGSRYGGGIKQLAAVDEMGHIIMDYSVHDAIEAGFGRIVFVIRHAIEAEFKAVIGERIEKICAPLGVRVSYAYQEVEDIPGSLPEGRTKPWGTAHAVLSCLHLADGPIEGPFVVINADDYYGKRAFACANEFAEAEYGLVGYVLSNTLSENGSVSRGVCDVEAGKLKGIVETKNIIKTAEGASAGGQALALDTIVSMNFWHFPEDFLRALEEKFPAFLANMRDPLKDEYMIPNVVQSLMDAGIAVRVRSTADKWFGVTYQEDKPAVMEGFRRLIEAGVYKSDLYSDLRA